LARPILAWPGLAFGLARPGFWLGAGPGTSLNLRSGVIVVTPSKHVTINNQEIRAISGEMQSEGNVSVMMDTSVDEGDILRIVSEIAVFGF